MWQIVYLTHLANDLFCQIHKILDINNQMSHVRECLEITSIPIGQEREWFAIWRKNGITSKHPDDVSIGPFRSGFDAFEAAKATFGSLRPVCEWNECETLVQKLKDYVHEKENNKENVDGTENTG